MRLEHSYIIFLQTLGKLPEEFGVMLEIVVVITIPRDIIAGIPYMILSSIGGGETTSTTPIGTIRMSVRAIKPSLCGISSRHMNMRNSVVIL